MTRYEKIVQVFLASPSDVADERDIVAAVAEELNLTWPENAGLRLEVVRWETHARPGVGADGQDVINRQLSPDTDVFVGVMWTRFGSPTERAASGTKEEFDRAMDAALQAPGCKSVMFYFKKTSPELDAIDVQQLAQVRAFAASVRDQGLLTWDFADSSEFESLVRLHLTRELWQRSNSSRRLLSPTAVPSSVGLAVVGDVAETAASYLGNARRFFGDATAAATRISDAARDMKVLLERAVDDADRISNPQARVAHLRRQSKHWAGAFNEFVLTINRDAPLQGVYMTEGMQAYSNALSFHSADSAGAVEQLSRAAEAARDLYETTDGLVAAVVGLRAAMKLWPRLQQDFNHARRSTIDALTRMVASTSGARDVTGMIADEWRQIASVASMQLRPAVQPSLPSSSESEPSAVENKD